MSKRVSTPSVDTASGLAQIVENIQRALADETTWTDDDRVGQLQHDLNEVQYAQPKSEQIRRLRVQWLQLGIESYETHLVAPAEAGALSMEAIHYNLQYVNWHKHVIGTKMGSETLECFATEGYLGKDFPRLATKLLELFLRLRKLPVIQEDPQYKLPRVQTVYRSLIKRLYDYPRTDFDPVEKILFGEQ